jgi:thiol-disulfide isomerase/thioredoxin
MLGDRRERGLIHRSFGLIAALSLALAASCQREPGAPANGALATPEPPRASAPASAPAPPQSALTAPPAPPASSVAASPAPPPERPFTLVELAPTQGDLTPLVAEQVERAHAQGKKPFVEFYADWCGPCAAVHRSMDDPRMIDAFRGTYIVRLNVDDWKDKLPGTGFVPREIPVFYAVNKAGRPSGRSLLGLSWGKSIPENMAPKLAAFFRG